MKTLLIHFLFAVCCTMQALGQHISAVVTERVTFKSGSNTLVGILYKPADAKPNAKLSAVVVTGSWTTVKEQMPAVYAARLAEQGFLALAFDFTGYGESGGKDRNVESAKQKVQDIKAAATYLLGLKTVQGDKVGALSICASAGYMAIAAAEDSRIKSYVGVAPWLHNAEIVKAIYGGEEGVKTRVAQAQAARKQYQQNGMVEYIPAMSTTNPKAAMYGEFFGSFPWDYYTNENRGRVPQWPNQFAVMAWEEWLTFDPIAIAPRVMQPVLLVGGPTIATPQGADQFYEKLPNAKKQKLWIEGPVQLDFYDQAKYVWQATEAAAKWFKETM
jgi:fermentation-respiration switch protein FrsA (DUF1100 family)